MFWARYNRKKPDIKYNRTGEDIDSLVKIQKQILATSAEKVKPGGVLVYSTCTICPKENEKNAMWFQENFPFILESITFQGEKKEFLQLFPHVDETDGFLLQSLGERKAKMERRDIKSLTLKEIQEDFLQVGEKSFRAKTSVFLAASKTGRIF